MKHVSIIAPAHRPRDESGVALVLALLFIVLLTALVVDFSYEMQVDASFVEGHSSNFEALVAAKSAVAGALGLLAADVYIGEEEAKFQGGEIFDSLLDPWAEGVPLSPLNDGVMQADIDDEYGKINVNALVYADENGQEFVHPQIEIMLRLLFEVREAEEDPVDAILDWLDSDDEPRDLGAENDYYTSLETPYSCKNGPMDSIEELLLIPGITVDLYFGDPELEQVPLNELLTVHGHPEGHINVNTAEFEVLEAYFAAAGDFPNPSVTAEQTIANIRDRGPYSSRDQLVQDGLIVQQDPQASDGRQSQSQQAEETTEEAGPDDRRQVVQPSDILDWSSSVFRIFGDGQSADTLVRVEAYVWRDTHQSGAAQMFRVLDWRIVQ